MDTVSHTEILSVQELQDALAAGLSPKFLFFWGHTSNTTAVGAECLSQWYEAPFDVSGRRFPTAEHYMMFRKAQLFEDHAVAAEVLSAKSAGKAKALGRMVKNFEEALWKTERFEIVVAGNVAKFAQNAPLRDFLCGTKHRVLVEASPRDRIWGIGLARTAPEASQPSKWQGLNLLGFALMKARSLFSESSL